MTSGAPSFELVLKNEKTRQYDRIALLFILLNLGYLVYKTLTTEIYLPRTLSFSGAVIISLLLAIYFFPGSDKKNRSMLVMTACLVICFTWMMLQNWWLLVLTLTTGILYMISRRKMSVMLMKEHIVYPSFPMKTIAWPELSSVILRDGLLTINFRNDRFIQQPVDESATAVNEPDFNEFCRQQLSK